MSYWKCKVNTFERDSHKRERVVMHVVLVEADDADAAFAAAAEHAARSASFGTKCLQVEVREAATTMLPFTVSRA